MSNAFLVCLAGSILFFGSDAFRKKFEKSAIQHGMASGVQQHLETLSNLKDLARKVASGEEKITDTSRLALSSIKEEMLTIIDDTNKQHTENQDQLYAARDAIEFCGTVTTEQHTNPGGIHDLEKRADQGRTAHSTCRTTETSTLTDKVDKCDAFQTYKDDLIPPSCTCSFQDESVDQMQECLGKQKRWAEQHAREFPEKRQACDDSTLLHDQTHELCEKQQASFEGGFCTYASTLTEVCDAQIECRTEFISARNKTHSEVQVAEEGRKAEYTSAEMVLCLLDVLNATAAEMPGLLQQCEGKSYGTSHLDMEYPGIPAAAACDPSPAASKPCDDSWRSKEYGAQTAWFNFAKADEKVQPSACVACITDEPTDTPQIAVANAVKAPSMRYIKIDETNCGWDPNDADCQMSNQLNIGNNGERWDSTTRDTTGTDCGPTCTANAECIGFIYYDGKCYYRKSVTCGIWGTSERDCYVKEAETKAIKDVEEEARKEAEEKARKEAEEKARKEAEEEARRDAEEKARKEAEEKAQKEAEEKARKEAEEKARKEAEERARKEAEEKARKEAEEKARREAEEKARKEAEAKARKEAEEKARKEAEEKARREAEEKARKEAELKARIEAEANECTATLYEHGDFSGWAAKFTVGNYDFPRFLAHGAKNDHASAIKVTGGDDCHVVVYEHNFDGWKAVFTPGVYDYNGFLHAGAMNDHASSIKVIQAPECKATVYEHGDFSGWAAEFTVGDYDYDEFVAHGAHNDHASAVKVVGGDGCHAEVYEHGGFHGWKAVFTPGVYDYHAFVRGGATNDHASSIKVVQA